MDPDAPTLATMGVAARCRAQGWRLCARILAGPDQDFVERLRDGRILDDLRAVAAWIGEDDPFATDARTLKAFAGRSKVVTLDDDVAALSTEWERILPDPGEPLEWCLEAAADCEAEAAAWETGDAETAKAARLAQFMALRDRLQPLADLCVRLDAGAQVLVVRALARIVAVHVGVEAGRDIRGQLFG